MKSSPIKILLIFFFALALSCQSTEEPAIEDPILEDPKKEEPIPEKPKEDEPKEQGPVIGPNETVFKFINKNFAVFGNGKFWIMIHKMDGSLVAFKQSSVNSITEFVLPKNELVNVTFAWSVWNMNHSFITYTGIDPNSTWELEHKGDQQEYPTRYSGPLDRVLKVDPPKEGSIVSSVYALEKMGESDFRKSFLIHNGEETTSTITIPFPKAFEYFYWYIGGRIKMEGLAPGATVKSYSYENWNKAPEKIELMYDWEIEVGSKKLTDFQIIQPTAFTYQQQNFEFKINPGLPGYRRIYWEVLSKERNFKILEIPHQILSVLDFNPDLSNPTLMLSIIYNENTGYEDHIDMLFKGKKKVLVERTMYIKQYLPS